MSMSDSKMRPILAAIRSAPIPSQAEGRGDQTQSGAHPFITVSRETGAGGAEFAERLTQRLNRIYPDDGWRCYDRELCERIASDLKVSRRLVETLEESCHSWLDDFWAGLSYAHHDEPPTEALIYRKVAAMIRALARAGRSVIVGRGSVYVTADMVGGVHVRLIAPLAHRIDRFAVAHGLTTRQAANRVRELDRNRGVFYKRYWPGRKLGPARFHLTINTAVVPEDRMVDCALPLVVAS